MLPDVELQFQPNTINCLTWSQDGELAIAAGEFIHILIPRWHDSGRGPTNTSSSPWDHVHFRANTFTVKEWPVQDGASFFDSSIGEEQSTCIVTAISWSPPGLGKHRRSVLAVLTSNLIVSCWASNSNPAISTSWQRISVINNAVRKWWDQNGLFEQEHAPTEDELRRKFRVRSMSWAPWACSPGEKTGQSLGAKRGAFMLAVGNDDSDILFLLLSSPYTRKSTSWNCSIIKVIRVIKDTLVVLPDVQADASQINSPDINDLPHIQTVTYDLGGGTQSIQFHPSLFKSALEGKHFIDHITWGPWGFGDVAETIVTFSRDGVFYHCLFEAQFQVSENSVFAEMVRLDFRRCLSQECDDIPFGSWSAMWHNQDTNEEPLVALARRGKIHLSSWNWGSSELSSWHDGPYRLKPDKDRWGNSEARTFKQTNEPWDPLSGIMFVSPAEDSAVYLYLTTHLSHIEVVKIQRNIHNPRGTGLICESSAPPTLERRMIKIRDRFDRREGFGGLSIMKTWGLATFGDYVAACITLHPGDMPEYLIPSQERATIVFSVHGLSDPSSKREYFPWEARAKVKSENVPMVQSAILDTIFKYEPYKDLKPSALGNKIIYAAIMASTLVWDSARPERLQLAKSAAERLSKSAEVDLSPEIECLNILLSDNVTQGDDNHNSSAAKALLQQAMRRRSETSSSSSSPASSQLFDICTVCGKHVTWKNLLEATCVAGHPYSRCALTFLAICQPSISKFCSRCNRAFLNEHNTRILSSASAHLLTNAEAQAEAGAETKAEAEAEAKDKNEDDRNIYENENENEEHDKDDLAEMLFRKYDTCPYCGGKFVG